MKIRHSNLCDNDSTTELCCKINTVTINCNNDKENFYILRDY